MRDNNIYSVFLKNAALGEWSAVSMTTAIGTYYSDPLEIRSCKGYAALLVTTSAGSLAITQELSLDGINFYTPYDTSGNDLGSIYAALTVGSKWIDFGPKIARYMRFKFVLTSANATVSARYIHQE